MAASVSTRALILLALPVIVGSLLGACAGSSEPSGVTIDVSLQEWAIRSSVDAVTDPAYVTIVASNFGPDRPHELLVIRTDRAPDALPTGPDGSVAKEQVDIVGATAPFVGSEEITLALSPGNYVLVCNLTEVVGGELRAHYGLGMYATLTVG